MKKLLSITLVATLMIGCSNERVVDLHREVITFGNAFVDSTTRADYSNGQVVDAFEVYGTASNTAGQTEQVFGGTMVTRLVGEGTTDGSAWNYEAPQYWLPSATYRFVAVVDGEVKPTDSLPQEILFAVEDGEANKDLLFAIVGAETNAVGTPISCDVVELGFEHLLSKMQFVVVNNNPTVGDRDNNGYEDHYVYEVTDITVEGFAQEGIFVVEEQEIEGRKCHGTWRQSGTTSTTLSFGSTDRVVGCGNCNAQRASQSRQFLPVEQELEVCVTCNVYLNGTLTTKGAMLVEVIDSRPYKVGRSYIITASILGNEMGLSVGSSDNWN